MLQETPCYERHTQALFLICDRKHDEISPVWKVLISKMHQCQLSKQWISRARLSKIKQADSLREETIKAHVMGLPYTHRLKRSALIKKGTKRQTRATEITST